MMVVGHISFVILSDAKDLALAPETSWEASERSIVYARDDEA